LFHPTTGSWVRRVSSSLQLVRPKSFVLHARLSLRRRHPSKSSPRRQPYRVTAASCLLTVAFLSGTPAPAAELSSCVRVASNSKTPSAHGTLSFTFHRPKVCGAKQRAPFRNAPPMPCTLRRQAASACPIVRANQKATRNRDIGLQKPLSRNASTSRRTSNLSCALFYTPQNRQRQATSRRLTS